VQVGIGKRVKKKEKERLKINGNDTWFKPMVQNTGPSIFQVGS